MKFDFVADTNFLIYVHEGNKIIEPFLEYNFGISFITEVELLGYKDIFKSDEEILHYNSNLVFWSKEGKIALAIFP
jgi:hypothetical protein